MTAAIQKIEPIPLEFTQDKLDLLKNTVCKGATNDEFQLFLHVCKRTGLDPFMRQIYSIPRGGQRTIQTAIDGLRLIAERTNRYSPGKEPTYVYDANSKLMAATSYVKKMTMDGSWHEVCATAFFDEYNAGTNFWKKMPHNQLSKCAEALALRKAFPAEMSGIYSQEEMDQADKVIVEDIKEQDLSQEEINAYLDQWENREKFQEFTLAVMKSRKWNFRKVIEAFNKDPDKTSTAFENWVNKSTN